MTNRDLIDILRLANYLGLDFETVAALIRAAIKTNQRRIKWPKGIASISPTT